MAEKKKDKSQTDEADHPRFSWLDHKALLLRVFFLPNKLEQSSTVEMHLKRVAY